MSERKYPVQLAENGPPPVTMIPIPIPACAIDHGLHFTGTPLGRAYAFLVYFLLQMCYDRFRAKRKPKPKGAKASAANSSSVDVHANDPANAHPGTIHESDDENSGESDDEDALADADDAGAHARDVARAPNDDDEDNENAAPSADDTDDAFELLMVHGELKVPKVRIFIETVVHGHGVIAGYVIWFGFYEQGLFNRMFLSMLGYNQAFCSKNAPALQKMRSKPSDYDIATRNAIEVNSVTSYKDTVQRIVAGRIPLADAHLTNLDLVKNGCPYNLVNLFSYNTIVHFFPDSWNFCAGPHNMPCSVKADAAPTDPRPRYPWFVMEVPDSLIERPYELTKVPIDTVLREEVMSILRDTQGEISAAQRDEINVFVASMPNVMQQRMSEEINKLLEERDHVYRIGNVVRDMREHGATDEEIQQFFRERFDSLHHEMFRTPGGAINCSEAELHALRCASSVTLPRAIDPPIFPQRSSLSLRSDVLRQFLETLVNHLFVHKGDRLNQAMSVYLTSLACDSSYTNDELVIGLFGEKETGKSTAIIFREHMTCDHRAKRMDSITPKTFEVNDNLNNHVIMFDEVNEAVLGINTANMAKPGSSTGNACVNALKQGFTGGYHKGVAYAGDTSDRSSRGMAEYLITLAAAWIFSQNMRMNIVAMSPLISRFWLYINTYASRTFLDADSLVNNDNGLTRDLKACLGPYGQRFVAFAKQIDLIMLIYCIYVKMGAFAPLDTTFARCTMNAMNDCFGARRMKRYSTRLGDRIRTLIRRTDIWLSILTFFSSGLSHRMLGNKTHLDFDVLITLDGYIKANGCSVQAIAYVLTLLSTEIIVDTNHIVCEAFRTARSEGTHVFEEAEEDKDYFKSRFRSRSEMAAWLTEMTGINAMDAPNALFALTKPMPCDASGIKTYRPLKYADNHMAAFLIHKDFLIKDEKRAEINAKDEFLSVLQQCLCLERSEPQTVLTSFAHRHAVTAKTSVTLGAVAHCLHIAPVRGRYLVHRRHNPDASDVARPTLVEYIADDALFGREPALRHLAVLSVDEQAALPLYPDAFAADHYTAIMQRRRESAFLAEVVQCVPHYCISADVMLLDEANATADLAQRITRYFPAVSDPASRTRIAALFVLQTEWYRLLYRQWKLSLHYRRWLELATTRTTEDIAPAVRDVELEIADSSTDMDGPATRSAYNELKALRNEVSNLVGASVVRAVFGQLADDFGDAVPLPPWYALLPCEAHYRAFAPSFDSASDIAPLRLLGSVEQRALIEKMDAVVERALKRSVTMPAMPVPMPPAAAVLAYDVGRSSMERTITPLALTLWRKGDGAPLIDAFVRVRRSWCALRHTHALLLEYKMLTVLAVLFSNSLHAHVAHARVRALEAALAAAPLPPPLDLPPAIGSGVAPPVSGSALEATFAQYRAVYDSCCAHFGRSVFETTLKNSVIPLLVDQPLADVLNDEMRTTIYAAYGALFDAHIAYESDLNDEGVSAALMADPLIARTPLRFLDIEESAVRSAAFHKSEDKRIAGRVESLSDRALCKRRMIAFSSVPMLMPPTSS